MHNIWKTRSFENRGVYDVIDSGEYEILSMHKVDLLSSNSYPGQPEYLFVEFDDGHGKSFMRKTVCRGARLQDMASIFEYHIPTDIGTHGYVTSGISIHTAALHNFTPLSDYPVGRKLNLGISSKSHADDDGSIVFWMISNYAFDIEYTDPDGQKVIASIVPIQKWFIEEIFHVGFNWLDCFSVSAEQLFSTWSIIEDPNSSHYGLRIPISDSEVKWLFSQDKKLDIPYTVEVLGQSRERYMTIDLVESIYENFKNFHDWLTDLYEDILHTDVQESGYPRTLQMSIYEQKNDVRLNTKPMRASEFMTGVVGEASKQLGAEIQQGKADVYMNTEFAEGLGIDGQIVGTKD